MPEQLTKENVVDNSIEECIRFLEGIANQYAPNDSDLNEGYYDPAVYRYMHSRAHQTITLIRLLSKRKAK